MKSDLISFRAIPRTSALYLNYLYDFGRVADFYAWNPGDQDSYHKAAAAIQMDASQREGLCRVLVAQNRSFGCGDPALSNIRRLAQAGTTAVVTGQQVGLFGGPSYTVYKAVTAIRLASDLSAQGIPAVPVFWMASYDHDFEEVNHTTLLDHEFRLFRVEDSARPERDAPVGNLQFDRRVERMRERAGRLWRSGAHEADGVEVLSGYAPGGTYASAFAAMLSALFRDDGLIVLDPATEDFQRLARPMYGKVIADGTSLVTALQQQTRAVRDAGYHAQVDVRDESTLLFAEVEGRRKLLRRAGGGLAVPGRDPFSRKEIDSMLQDEPHRFTASALLRPVVQDSIFPTVAYVGGPAEVAYFAQTASLYRSLLGRMPVVVPRASITLVEPRVERLLRKYDFSLEDVMTSFVQLRGRVAARRVQRRLAGKMETTHRKLREMMASTGELLDDFDPTLAGAVDTSRRKMLYQFEKIQAKVARAQAEQNGIADRHSHRLHNSLYPGRNLQERSVNFLSFIARYGRPLIRQLLAAEKLLSREHLVMRV